MIRKIILFTFLILIFESGFAQGYRIKINLPFAANKEVQLTYHYHDRVYSRDTILLDQSGVGAFTSDTLTHQGLYKLVLDKDHHFDFLLGADQDFQISGNTMQAADIHISGSEETQAFFNYLVFLDKLKAEGKILSEQLKQATPNAKPGLNAQLNNLTTRLHNYWEEIGDKLPDSFLYRFVKANYVPALDISALPDNVKNDEQKLLLARFNYQREHYWDNFDYTDERFLFTPFYKSKLDNWFKNVLYPSYDSVKPYVYEYIENIEDNKRIFQFATSFLLNASINSKVIGMDALFVDLANDYYFNGKAFWANEESMEKIRENVLFFKDNLIGKTAPDLTLESLDGEFVNLHQIDAEITLLLIYEPHCGHCKVFVPELYKDVYSKYKEKGLEVYAIYSMDKKEEWEEFLVKHNMFDWVNVWDKDHTSRFKILYDARKTPGIYMLDKNKKIISKKLSIEQIKKLLGEKLNE